MGHLVNCMSRVARAKGLHVKATLSKRQNGSIEHHRKTRSAGNVNFTLCSLSNAWHPPLRQKTVRQWNWRDCSKSNALHIECTGLVCVGHRRLRAPTRGSE